MAQLSTSLARKARAFTLAAASLMAIASPTAGHAEIEGLPPQCKSAGDKLAQLRCGSAYYQQKKKEAEARGADADRRASAANASSQCIDRVVREAGNPKSLNADQKAAVRARILACG